MLCHLPLVPYWTFFYIITEYLALLLFLSIQFDVTNHLSLFVYLMMFLLFQQSATVVLVCCSRIATKTKAAFGLHLR